MLMEVDASGQEQLELNVKSMTKMPIKSLDLSFESLNYGEK